MKREEKRACVRCGRIRNANSSRKTNLCRDCLDADPEYVKMIGAA